MNDEDKALFMTHETDIALLKSKVADLVEQNNRQRDDIDALKKLDDQRVRAGLVVMGSVVVSLVVYIYNLSLGK